MKRSSWGGQRAAPVRVPVVETVRDQAERERWSSGETLDEAKARLAEELAEAEQRRDDMVKQVIEKIPRGKTAVITVAIFFGLWTGCSVTLAASFRFGDWVLGVF